MPICSYVVQPTEGATERLCQALNSLPGCDATQADAHDLIVLVTETNSVTEETALRDRLKEQPDIACLNLTFGNLDSALALQKEASQ